MTSKRLILLHYHIFKNAGSTIISILKRNFLDSFQEFDRLEERGRIPANTLIKHLKWHPSIKALSSHHIRYPRPEYPGITFVDICFIRHPLDRLQSMYYYYRRISDDSDKSIAAKSMTLPGFLLWMSEVEPFNIMDVQTRYMLGGGFFSPPTPLNLNTALECVADVRFLGVVDRFNESLIVARFFLKPIFPNLDFTYSPENISENWQLGLTEKLDRMKNLCGWDLFDWLMKVNQNDEKLWMYATNELTRRLEYVPSGQRHWDALAEGIIPKDAHG